MKSIIKAVIKTGCVNCGKEKENKRSSYCNDCFEDLLKTKVKES